MISIPGLLVLSDLQQERSLGVMTFFLENRWILLAGLEVLAWLATFFMLYARYGMKSTFWFRVGVMLLAITGVIPQVLMGIMNVIATREMDVFTLVIVLLILYGSTIGKKHVKRLDAWAQAKFARSQEKR
jgi:hypothetical protein